MTFVNRLEKFFNLILGALSPHFHPAILQIHDPSGDVKSLGKLPAGISKTDALNHSRVIHMCRFHDSLFFEEVEDNALKRDEKKEQHRERQKPPETENGKKHDNENGAERKTAGDDEVFLKLAIGREHTRAVTAGRRKSNSNFLCH